MNIYHIILNVTCCLMLSSVSFAQIWTEAASLKKELMQAALQGKTYYSQFNFYDPRKSGELKSVYENVLRCRPQIYGVDFYYASDTWYKPKDIRKARENLIKIVKEAWRERRAIASFSWHLDNPYVPTGFPRFAGFRYVNSKHIPDYPVEHSYVIKEILEGWGGVCGKGNLSGKDNALGYPSPRAWFEERCKEHKHATKVALILQMPPSEVRFLGRCPPKTASMPKRGDPKRPTCWI